MRRRAGGHQGWPTPRRAALRFVRLLSRRCQPGVQRFAAHLAAGRYANICSVGVAGSDHGRFTKALVAGHLTTALIYARDLPHVSLGDALTLCRLMAQGGDDRFPRAASRWLERLSAEAGAGLLEVQMAAAALSKLWEEPDDEIAMSTLRALSP